MIGIEEIGNAVRELGLRGADVCVHASLRSFGDALEGGAEALTEAFLAEGCTLLVPTFSDLYEAAPAEPYLPPRNGMGDGSYFREREYPNRVPYTPDSREITTEEMGFFPGAVLEHPGSVRGGNPLNSFTALGKDAARLVGGQTARDVYAPLRELCAADGFLLLMGVGPESATLIHYAEQLAGRTPFIRWSLDASGRTVPVSAGSCSEGFGKLLPAMLPHLSRVTVGKSEWLCGRAAALAEACRREIVRTPEITRCADPDCDRCRDAVHGGPILPPGFWD